MNTEELKQTIAAYWEKRAEIAPASCPQELHDALAEAMSGLDSGKLRVAELNAKNEWHTNVWLKQAVLLYFRSKDMRVFSNFDLRYWDKVELKFSNWSEKEFRQSGIRVVPGAIVRRGTFIDRDAVLMPSFINIGARVGKGSMIDTWATVGSCAQIGNRVHISGGAGIGGVLEPLQAAPVIIEDDCFIGARSEVAEGVRVEKGSVLSMGVFLGASTKIYDRESGETFYGRVPPYSVVVPGSLPGSKKSDAMLSAAIIVKRVDEKTRAKTEINDLLRE